MLKIANSAPKIGIPSVLIAIVIAGCNSQPACPTNATRANDQSAAINQARNEVATSIMPGMTNDEAGKKVFAKFPNALYLGSLIFEREKDTSEKKPLGFQSYDLGNEVHLVLAYHQPGGPAIDEGAEVSSVEVVTFHDLARAIPPERFSDVMMVNEAPSLKSFDPAQLIRVCNVLQSGGKDRAVAALRAYVDLCKLDTVQSFKHNLDEQRALWVARILFENPDGGPLPALRLGVALPAMDSQVGPSVTWPLYPIVVDCDIPFTLAEGYALGGQAEDPKEYLDYCVRNCRFRDHPLVPTASPYRSATKIVSGDAWRNMFNNDAELMEIGKMSLAKQVMRASIRGVDVRELRPLDQLPDVKAMEQLRWSCKSQRFE